MQTTLKKYIDTLAKAEISKEEVVAIKKEVDEKKAYWKDEEFETIFLEELEKLSENEKVIVSYRLRHGFQCSVSKEQVDASQTYPKYTGKYYAQIGKYENIERKRRNKIAYENNLDLLHEILNELKTGLADEVKLKKWNNEMKNAIKYEIEQYMRPLLAELSNEEFVAIANHVLRVPEEKKDLYDNLDGCINDINYAALERILDIANL